MLVCYGDAGKASAKAQQYMESANSVNIAPGGLVNGFIYRVRSTGPYYIFRIHVYELKGRFFNILISV